MRDQPSGSALAGHGSEVVVGNLDVVAIRIEHERSVVARVIDGALNWLAMVFIPCSEYGRVEGPHRGIRVRGKRELDVLRDRAVVAHEREAVVLAPELHVSRRVMPKRRRACGAIAA